MHTPDNLCQSRPSRPSNTDGKEKQTVERKWLVSRDETTKAALEPLALGWVLLELVRGFVNHE